MGKRAEADGELRKYLDTQKAEESSEWALKVGRFVVGDVGEVDLLAAAKNADAKIEAQHFCEAYFYAGELRLLGGDRKGAKDDFKKCVATEARTYWEYRGAVGELRLME
jgi:lipoprotein NlpI